MHLYSRPLDPHVTYSQPSLSEVAPHSQVQSTMDHVLIVSYLLLKNAQR